MVFNFGDIDIICFVIFSLTAHFCEQ